MSVKSIRSDAEPFLESLGWVLLVPVVVVVVFTFGALLAGEGIDEILHASP